ncbi:LamG-like jellyroll fold domain-containing protein [Planctomycetaceae bacterium SH139]
MDEANHPRQIDPLLARLVDGDATPDDIAAIESLLDGNPEAQRRYLHYLDLHQELLAKGNAGLADTTDEPRFGELESATNRQGVPRTKAIVILGLAASMLVATGIGVARWTKSTPSDNTREDGNFLQTIANNEEADSGVAVLTGAVNAQWLGDAFQQTGPPQTGSILSPGELQLVGGVIQIEFYNGVQLLVEGPADLEIRSVASVVCRRGKLRSRVPPNATGFSVLTSKFELVDLGTEFAVDVTNDGRADVHVFDGEVEIYSPDGSRKADDRKVLLGGDAMQWSNEGAKTAASASPQAFASFETVRQQSQTLAGQRLAKWRRWNEKLQEDPRVAIRYDFEDRETTLSDRGTAKAHGTIVGCGWTSGRWPEKHALEFRRPGDRVRIDVPGQFDQLTLSMWLRMDALPGRTQSLLLTDGYEVGRVHWQVSAAGELRLGLRLPSETKKMRTSGYGSPVLFTPRSIGTWNFVCTVYDRSSQQVRHFLNGRLVSSEPMAFDQPIQIGMAEIGNWGLPLNPESPNYVIRNFIGRVDELTIWNTALDEREIASIYGDSHP